jgi:enoyl-CoA hydratase
MLKQMLGNGPLALEACITAANEGADLELPAALALEARKFGLLAKSADMQEGTAAFLEKRAPVFRGV